MPLWYNTNSGFKAVSFNQLNSNLDVYFCCPGPSLKQIEPQKLNGVGRLVAAVNNSYPFVKPDIWFGMDDPNCYSRQVFWEPFIKVMRGGYENRTCFDREIKNNFNLFYADVKKYENHEHIFTNNNDNTHFIWKNNVMATALHILIWMGAKNIYFLGCDLDNTQSDYHHEQSLSKKEKEWNRSLYKELYGWIKWLTKTASKYGIQIKSCSKDSQINNFMEYIDIENAIANSERGIPTGGELQHTLNFDEKASK